MQSHIARRAFVQVDHGLNMELCLIQSSFRLHVHSCTHWLRLRISPRILAHKRERYWSAKIDDISLWPPKVDTCLLSGRQYMYIWQYSIPAKAAGIARHLMSSSCQGMQAGPQLVLAVGPPPVQDALLGHFSTAFGRCENIAWGLIPREKNRVRAVSERTDK